MATKAEKLKALIWWYANNSKVTPPTPISIQSDIQGSTGTLYGLDTIARYLCDWYIAKDGQNKTHRYVRFQQMIEMALKGLKAAITTLENIQRDNF